MLEQIITQKLQLQLAQVQGTVRLLREGATIPFISRYRKEATGSLDEVQVALVKEHLDKLSELEQRKISILKTISEQGQLSPELQQRIDQCWDSLELEDLYLPYKPKRRTRATIAKERGLEPLAQLIFTQSCADILSQAQRFITKDVTNTEAALAGACDIIAERVAENPDARHILRRLFQQTSIIQSKVVKDKQSDGAKYADYFDASAPLRSVSSHRLLAMLRGQDEGFLKIHIDIDVEYANSLVHKQFIAPHSTTQKWIETAINDGIKRLMRPSIETEVITIAKVKADDEAIRVFADNLRQLLLSPPLGQKRVIAIDPGFRTGCKVVALDEQGQLLYHGVIYPHPPQNELNKAQESIIHCAKHYQCEAFAIGNGTAGRETEAFIRNLKLPNIEIYSVSEDGASIYSASPVAREEFPDQDLTVRGAISIGRRLIDPLSELVKIDPKSIGVGQYQHSVDQTKLKDKLNTVVERCVNAVGVNINTASKHLLSYVSGLGPTLAQNIVEYRNSNGTFQTRKDLNKVPRLGPKAFEQAAGFLRIKQAQNPLDDSAVHPESYHIVERMAKDIGVSIERFVKDKTLRSTIVAQDYVREGVGLPTVLDIIDALDKQGLDSREALETFAFDPSVCSIEDLRVGMILPGLVSNITAFGAFVNIGVKQDGLVHISQMSTRYVSNPSEIVRLGMTVQVKILEVDTVRKRIALSMNSL